MNRNNNIIDNIRKTAKDVLPVGGNVWLYGSRARGDNNNDSDWDILILLDKKRIDNADYDNIAFPITYYGWQVNENIIPIIYTKKQWESYSFTPFYKNIERDKIQLV